MILKNTVLDRKHKKPILWDAFFSKDNKQKPLVIFCHGYKGFKDWGCWDLVAESFSKANFFFVKFNFSHNGGTIENPIDFPDLKAFGENNYSKELDDLDSILNFLLSNENQLKSEIDCNNITLIGHSRGGGISIIKASEDSRITKLITWASVCNFGKRTATIGDLDTWKKNGVKYILNGRTKQQMPHNYQFYEDFIANEERLNIEKCEKKITIPHLIIHGKDDPSVFYKEAETLKDWNPKSELFPIQNCNHVFNSKHPWNSNSIPEALNIAIKKSINFI